MGDQQSQVKLGAFTRPQPMITGRDTTRETFTKAMRIISTRHSLAPPIAFLRCGRLPHLDLRILGAQGRILQRLAQRARKVGHRQSTVDLAIPRLNVGLPPCVEGRIVDLVSHRVQSRGRPKVEAVRGAGGSFASHLLEDISVSETKTYKSGNERFLQEGDADAESSLRSPFFLAPDTHLIRSRPAANHARL